MKIYVVLGTHKTGTSSIQRFIKSKSELFLEQGIYIANDFSNRKVDDDFFLDLSKSIEHAVNSDVKKYVLVNERLLGLYGDGYSEKKEYAERLKLALPNNCSVDISMTFRRQDSFIESAFMQLIHQGESINFNDFYNKVYSKFDWSDYLSIVESVFPSSRILPFEYKGSDAVSNFMEFIDFKIDFEKASEKKINLSYGRLAFDIANFSNEKTNQSQRAIIRRLLQDNLNSSLSQPCQLLTLDQKEKLRAVYFESNKKIIDRYSHFTSDFSYNKKFEVHNGNDINNQDVERALSVLFLEASNAILVNKKLQEENSFIKREIRILIRKQKLVEESILNENNVSIYQKIKRLFK
ncbi:hypothetical protein VCHA34P129_100050 [Vibrio chagasii]|nr:hypothetical protein VCHA34P129_100050 [Vibrio chagasii]CAH6909104.1 hypothetical protein VCHA52P455_100065 [Vibrio chagasii]